MKENEKIGTGNMKIIEHVTVIDIRDIQIQISEDIINSVQKHIYNQKGENKNIQTGTIYQINRTNIRLVPTQDVHFALIFWYVAKITPTLQELNLFYGRISMNYFDGDINLVPALE